MKPPKRKLTFLVVDNDPVLRKAQAQILADMGYTTILQAGNGTEAWSMFKNFDVDFVVAAWDLPEMTGFALLKVIRADMKHNSVPVVLVLGNATKVQVIEAGEAGVSELIIHPFTAEIFRQKIIGTIEAELDPQNQEAEAGFDRGTELMEKGKHEEALTAFREILEIYESAEIYYNMGYIKTAQGEYDEALACFRKATLINNTFARAFQKMGEVLVELGRMQEAEDAFQRAADIYMEKNMNQNAEAVLNEVIKINPDTINVYNSLGIIYRRQGKFEKSLSQYKRAMKVNPNDENIHYNMGRVYLVMKDFQTAAELLKKAVQINPKFTQAQELLDSIELGAGLN